MKRPQVFLVTSDRERRASLSEVVTELGADVARNVDTLDKVCGRIRQFDLAVIDFQHAAHGMTLLQVVKSCRADLPVIGLVDHSEKHIEALAYATGATRCLQKPLTKYVVTTAIQDLLRSRAQPMAA
jgi:CheY-like chemotaxis protein